MGRANKMPQAPLSLSNILCLVLGICLCGRPLATVGVTLDDPDPSVVLLALYDYDYGMGAQLGDCVAGLKGPHPEEGFVSQQFSYLYGARTQVLHGTDGNKYFLMDINPLGEPAEGVDPSLLGDSGDLEEEMCRATCQLALEEYISCVSRPPLDGVRSSPVRSDYQIGVYGPDTEDFNTYKPEHDAPGHPQAVAQYYLTSCSTCFSADGYDQKCASALTEAYTSNSPVSLAATRVRVAVAVAALTTASALLY